jgi:hypothetical protein
MFLSLELQAFDLHLLDDMNFHMMLIEIEQQLVANLLVQKLMSAI